MNRKDLSRSLEKYEAPEVELLRLSRGISILEEVSLGADIEDFEDGFDI